MCAIIDANVRDEVFRDHASDVSDAGARFFQWIASGMGKLVVGGTQILEELYGRAGVHQRSILANLRREGRIVHFDKRQIDERADDLRKAKQCQSNDQHIIALAQISRARLLYSNDQDLHKDFRNKSLIDRPRGSVYSTRDSKKFMTGHRDLLQNRELCGR